MDGIELARSAMEEVVVADVMTAHGLLTNSTALRFYMNWYVEALACKTLFSRSQHWCSDVASSFVSMNRSQENHCQEYLDFWVEAERYRTGLEGNNFPVSVS